MSSPATHPIASLKAAMRASLLADAAIVAAIGTAVHDGPPRGLEPPYLVLGDATARENATNDGDGRIIDLDLNLYTRERGSYEALAIIQKIEARIDGGAINLVDHRLVLMTLRETLIRLDKAKSLTRATLRLRAFTEPL